MTIIDRIGNTPDNLGVKAPCTLATTANIVLSGLQTVDGILLVANKRVLVKNQTDQTQNGIYQASTGAWTRPHDADNNEAWISGTQVFITSGTTNAGLIYECSCADDPIVIGTSLITFALVTGASGVPTSRNINTTAPLAGGGNLTADRTFSLTLAARLATVASSLDIATNGITAGYFRQSAALSVVGNGTNALANVTDIAGIADQVLVVNHAGTALAFGQVNLAAAAAVTGVLPGGNMSAVNLAASGAGGVTGTLPVANGGTGQVTLTNHAVLVGAGTSAITQIAVPASGTLFQGVASSDPIWTATPTLGVAATTAGAIALANGSGGGALATIQNPSATVNYNYNLPATAGTAHQVQTSGGGGSTAQNYENISALLTGGTNIAITGTVNATIAITGQIALANGGTAANLTADNGAIVYSTASALALLAHTATASLPLLSGASAAPTWATVSHPTSATSGGIAYFSSTTVMASSALLTQYGPLYGGGAGAAPVAMAAGTNGQLIIAQTGAAPLWKTLSGDATLDQTGALTIAAAAVGNSKLANMTSNTVKGNNSGGGVPADLTASQVLDMIGTTRGSLLERGASTWGTVAPGLTGQVFTSNGAGADPSWQSVSGTGTVTSVATAWGLTGGPITTSGTLSINTTNPPYGYGTPINLQLNATVGSSKLTIAVKGNNGNDPSATNPVLIPFRDSTIANGGPVWVAVTAALSIDTNAVGASLGSVNSTAFRLWVVAFNNGGTAVLALINCYAAGVIYPLPEHTVQSTTAMSGSATAAGVFYTPNGTTLASKAFCILGWVEYPSGLATAGTYGSAPTTVHLFGAGSKKPGDVVQQPGTETGASATGTTTFTANNSTPQNTSGTQFMSQAITPTSSANVLEIEAAGFGSLASNTTLINCFFQDSTANALATGWSQAPAAGSGFPFNLKHRMQAGTSSSTTFKWRAGPNSADTYTFNGATGNPYFNGTFASSLTIREYMA